MEYSHTLNIGIVNNNDKNTSVTFRLDYGNDKCIVGQQGQIMQLIAQNITIQYCVTYFLLEHEDFELSLKFSGGFKSSYKMEVNINDGKLVFPLVSQM